MMAESVLTTAQADLTEFGITNQEESLSERLGISGSSSAGASDLATIVETVSLGEVSEDEAQQPANKGTESTPVLTRGEGSASATSTPIAVPKLVRPPPSFKINL